jgi:uridine kinase
VSNTHLIAIAGPSCAGKTETAKAVAKLLKAPIIALDSYYIPLDHLAYEDRVRFNFDEPQSIDHDLLLQQVKDLISGQEVQVPIYDFAAYTRTSTTERVKPAPFVILEGLFVLYWDDVRELCDTTVYVDAPDTVCLERRKYRDVRERARTIESVTKQNDDMVRPMAAKYVWPSKQLAGLVVSGTDSISAEQVIASIATTTKTEASAIF